MEAVWSLAQWQGRKGEDRIVAVRRAWPLPHESGAMAEDSEDRPATPVSNYFQASLGTPSSAEPQQRRQEYALFAVLDGHSSAAAARFCSRAAVPLLESFLPPAPPSLVALAAAAQQALVQTCVELHRQFAKTGARGGCSLALVLQVGPLLTCASAGSSSCLLDTGAEVLLLSAEHRIDSSPAERARLEAAGCRVQAADASGRGPVQGPGAGIGPLRAWPGGLTLSRACGDFAVGRGIVPLPHVKQVLLPPGGGRLLLVTDSMRQLPAAELRQLLRTTPINSCANQVIGALCRWASTAADASVICADVVPPGVSWLAEQPQPLLQPAQPQSTQQQPVQQQQQRRQEDAGGLGVASAGKRVLRMLGLRRAGSGPPLRDLEAEALAQNQNQTTAVPPLHPSPAKLLIDFDSAALMGLVPGGGDGGMGAASGEGGGSDGAVGGGAVPIWWSEEVKEELEVGLRESHQLWHAVVRRKAAAGRGRTQRAGDLPQLVQTGRLQAPTAAAPARIPASQKALATPFGQAEQQEPVASDSARSLVQELSKRGASAEKPKDAGAVAARQHSLPQLGPSRPAGLRSCLRGRSASVTGSASVAGSADCSSSEGEEAAPTPVKRVSFGSATELSRGGLDMQRATAPAADGRAGRTAGAGGQGGPARPPLPPLRVRSAAPSPAGDPWGSSPEELPSGLYVLRTGRPPTPHVAEQLQQLDSSSGPAAQPTVAWEPGGALGRLPIAQSRGPVAGRAHSTSGGAGRGDEGLWEW